MIVLWFIWIILYQFRLSNAWWFFGGSWPEEERYHYPGFFTTRPPDYVNNTDTKVSSSDDTPDYRIEEPFFTIHDARFAHEHERPYRNSPPYKQSRVGTHWYSRWYHWYWPNLEREMGCFCNTVYRRFNVLAGCAVITSKHILTTATSTALILRSYGHLPNLYDILGGWYDTNVNSYNSSMYFTPSRIHIHPKYRYDYEVNVSHPIPCMYDLSVWSATHTFFGGTFWKTKVIICKRAASGWREYTSTTPRPGDLSVIAGFLFIKAYRRRPVPWFRYIIKTEKFVWPCPKSDWHWFHCVMGEYWGRYGFDSGGGMYGCYRNQGWRRDGMTGLCSFSLKLRAKQTTHYFTVVDTHPVLDFMYDAFLGLKPYVYLDSRFEDTKWASPQPYWGEHIEYTYHFGYEAYKQRKFVPKYRR